MGEPYFWAFSGVRWGSEVVEVFGGARPTISIDFWVLILGPAGMVVVVLIVRVCLGRGLKNWVYWYLSGNSLPGFCL